MMKSEKNPYGMTVQLRAWAKEAKRKEEEEWMFLKQKSSVKVCIKCSTYVR